jgi:hypothetical protein
MLAQGPQEALWLHGMREGEAEIVDTVASHIYHVENSQALDLLSSLRISYQRSLAR